MCLVSANSEISSEIVCTASPGFDALLHRNIVEVFVEGVCGGHHSKVITFITFVTYSRLVHWVMDIITLTYSEVGHQTSHMASLPRMGNLLSKQGLAH